MPQPGDRIEFLRPVYEHWAVYVGDGDVVHLTGEPGLGSVSNSSGMSGSGGTATVKREKLQDVAGKDKWNVNNSLDKKYQPRPADVIVREACKLVGSTLKYRVLGYNCEHFVNELRYGEKYSNQVLGGVVTGLIAAGGGFVYAATTLALGLFTGGGAVVAGAAMFIGSWVGTQVTTLVIRKKRNE